MLSRMVRDLTFIMVIFGPFWPFLQLFPYVVGDEDPLVVVGELLEVGGGAVPALGGAVVAEGDGAAGPGVDISLDSGDHLVIRL